MIFFHYAPHPFVFYLLELTSLLLCLSGFLEDENVVSVLLQPDGVRFHVFQNSVEAFFVHSKEMTIVFSQNYSRRSVIKLLFLFNFQMRNAMEWVVDYRQG